MSPDPLGGTIMNPQSLNGYAYVLNNPTNLVDPLGLLCESSGTYEDITDEACIAGGGTIVGLATTVTVNGSTDSTTTSDTQWTPWPYPGTSTPWTTGDQFVGGGGGGGGSRTQRGTQTQGCSVGNTGATVGQWFWGVVAADHMLIDFATGLGPRNREWGPSSAPSQLMASSPGVSAAVSDYLNKGQASGTYVFSPATGPWNAGLNPVQQYVGSYQWTVFPAPGGLDVQLSNFTSVHSGSYHLVPSHSRSAFPLGGTTHQYYDIFVPCKQ